MGKALTVALAPTKHFQMLLDYYFTRNKMEIFAFTSTSSRENTVSVCKGYFD